MPESEQQTRRILSAGAATTWVWLLLVALTLASLALGQRTDGGVAVMLVVLAIAVIKGQFIVDYFMELRRVRLLWRVLMLVYLAVVGGSIVIAYLLGLR